MNRLRYREKREGERRELYMKEKCASSRTISSGYGQLVSGLSIHATIGP